MSPSTSSPATRRRLAVWLVIVAVSATACAQENATVLTESNASIPLEVQPRDPQDPTPTPPPVAVESPTVAAAPEPDEQNDSASEPDLSTVDTADAPEISARGQALGCADATSLRRWLGSATPSVADAARAMPDQVWLCPDNATVAAELACYPDQTNAVLTALGELGEGTASVAEQIAASGTTFCASGDVIRLGINDLVNQLQDS